ncbi:hypothetical protein [Ruminiclostridium josui]
MYTGNIIGKANELSSKQISELVEIRRNFGINTGGVPKGKDLERSTDDNPPDELLIRDIVEEVTKTVLKKYRSN